VGKNEFRIYNPDGAENCYRFSGAVVPGACGRGFPKNKILIFYFDQNI
jgi:hypothetical protein